VRWDSDARWDSAFSPSHARQLACGFSIVGMDERVPQTQQTARWDLVRPRRGRIAAGVCVGVACRLDVSPTLVRVVFLVSLLLPGPQILAYLALWVLMPNE